MNFSTDKIIQSNVMSSRIRLARNVSGLPFPRSGLVGDNNAILELVTGALKSAQGVFDAELYLMSRLNKVQKMALVERHIISLPLANNDKTGAVILEKGGENFSIMLNEEDHIREQYVVDGFELGSAYKILDEYDDNLITNLPIAYQNDYGFLTACPTNVGTGIRASTLLFLPALKLANAIEPAIEKFTKQYGLTIRGVYGEGSSAEGDMYQLSNTRTLGYTEQEIIRIVELATIEMCHNERVALEKIMNGKGIAVIDRISRSCATLKSAYSISSIELMRLISDAKLAVILGIVPLKDARVLDKLVTLCSSSSLTIKIGQQSAENTNIMRAEFVRTALREEL